MFSMNLLVKTTIFTTQCIIRNNWHYNTEISIDFYWCLCKFIALIEQMSNRFMPLDVRWLSIFVVLDTLFRYLLFCLPVKLCTIPVNKYRMDGFGCLKLFKSKYRIHTLTKYSKYERERVKAVYYFQLCSCIKLKYVSGCAWISHCIQTHTRTRNVNCRCKYGRTRTFSGNSYSSSCILQDRAHSII